MESIKNFAGACFDATKSAGSAVYDAGAWAGTTIASGACTAGRFVSNVASTGWNDYLSPAAEKVASVVSGFFAAIHAWIQANPELAKGGALGLAVGAGIAFLIALACCRPEATPPAARRAAV